MRVLLAMPAFVLFVGIVVAQDDKKDAGLLQGSWSMVSGEYNGQMLPTEFKTGKRAAKIGASTITISGELFSITVNGQVVLKAKHVVDSAKKPKTINFEMVEGLTNAKTQLGIYDIDGDTLKLCFGAPGKERPTEFTAPAGSERTATVWKRETK